MLSARLFTTRNAVAVPVRLFTKSPDLHCNKFTVLARPYKMSFTLHYNDCLGTFIHHESHLALHWLFRFLYSSDLSARLLTMSLALHFSCCYGTFIHQKSRLALQCNCSAFSKMSLSLN